MGKLLILCAVVLACVGVEAGMKCLKCPFTFVDKPCHASKVTCETGLVCATIKGKATGHTFIKKKGCVEKNKCNQNETVNFAGVNYVATYKCCEGNYCNSGAMIPSAHLTLPVALAMFGAWLTRLL